MKKIIIPLIAIMLLTMPVLAVPENLTLGSYLVSFDAGKELHEWNVTDEESETYSGIPYITYEAKNESITVYVTSFSSSSPMDWNPTKRKSYWISSMLRDSCLCDTFTRIIDKKEGFVALVECHRGVGYLPAMFHAEWYDEKTEFGLRSAYPWDAGTLQLLKTIHIEKVK
jgi:hypothetical protein